MEDTRFWHPFADMGAVRRPRARDRARRGRLGLGRRTAAATSTRPRASGTRTSATAGREIAAAVAAQLAQDRGLLGLRRLRDRARRSSSPRCSPTARRCPRACSSTSGGGDSIDVAAKLARRYWYELGQPERTLLVSRTQGYHGTHGYGTAIGGIPANRVGFGPQVESEQVPHDSVEALEEAIDADRRRARRRLLRRAGDRRRRRLPARPALHRGRRRAVRAQRRAARRRLRDLRLRPARHLVRDRALGRRRRT